MQFTIATILALAATSFASPQKRATDCRLSPSVLKNPPPGVMPANLDGVCISTSACSSVGGESFNQQCGAGTSCCIKAPCATTGEGSACLYPNLAGDAREPGSFVAGTCPTGLRCFKLASA